MIHPPHVHDTPSPVEVWQALTPAAREVLAATVRTWHNETAAIKANPRRVRSGYFAYRHEKVLARKLREAGLLSVNSEFHGVGAQLIPTAAGIAVAEAGQRQVEADAQDPRAAKPIDLERLTASDIERFWSRIERHGPGWPCWLWKGHRERTGYALFQSKGLGRVAVHRLVYTLERGPIPVGMTLDHRCRVRHCCNPVHLEPVSSAENTRRGEGPTARNARKTHCAHGHEFTPDNVMTETDRQGRTSRKCRACNRAKCAAKHALRRAVAAARQGVDRG